MSNLVIARKGYKKPVSLNANLFWDGGVWGGLATKGLDITKHSDEELDNLTKLYKQSTNVFGISKENNPFSKGNLKMAGKAVGTAALGMAGQLIGDKLADGYSSGIGNTIRGLSGLAEAVPVYGKYLAPALNVVGAGISRITGSKVNEAALRAANEGTAALNNFKSNASYFDDIKSAPAVANVGTVYEGAGAASKNAELRRQRGLALSWANRSIENNINNIANEQMNNALANYAAFGGGLDTFSITPSAGPIEYAYLTDKQVLEAAKNKSNNMTSMFSGAPSMLAFGGDVQLKGADWSTGLTHVSKGGTHEENPNQGVLMGVDNQGTPNLVEEGEVIYDDYVFSNRLTIPNLKRGNYGKRNKYAKGSSLKKSKSGDSLIDYDNTVLKPYAGLTYADAAKKAEKISGAAERPNDPIALRGLKAILGVLATSQEKEREKERLKEMQEAIDNMSPEELAMLQQLMAASQQQANQQAMAEQQQQMIPQGMELMQYPMEEQQPIAALGGLLNGWNPVNKFALGGNSRDDNWYNQLPEGFIRWLVDSYNLSNNEDLEKVPYEYQEALKKVYEYALDPTYKDYPLQALWSESNAVDPDLMKSIIETGIANRSFDSLTSDELNNLARSYIKSLDAFKEEHPYGVYGDRERQDVLNYIGEYLTSGKIPEVTTLIAKPEVTSSVVEPVIETPETTATVTPKALQHREERGNIKTTMVTTPEEDPQSVRQYTEEQLKLRKSLERKYRKGTKNFDYDKLSDYGKAAFDADFQRVLENPDLLKEDKDNQLSISRYEETKPDISFSHFATNEARDSYLPEISLNDNGKLSIKYNDEGTIPQGLSFLEDGVTYDKENKVWKNRAGEVINNPFTKDYGFTDISRNWNNWGYIDNEGNWQSVDAPQSSTSGTTDYRFTPTAEWSKDLGDAKDYELKDFYLNNYADFIEALNKGDLAALQRLYTLGEATKSNNPEERRGKNRYFRDDADFNNLKKEDVIGYNPNDPRGGIFGNNYYTDAFGIETPYSEDYNFAVSNNGNLIRVGNERWNSLSDEEKKKYTQIEGPLTREHLMNNLKWAINLYPENWVSDANDLYLQGISDNVWGPHHLISNRGTKRYALVDDSGNYRKDANGNIRYINYNPEATYQYYNEGNPIDTQSMGDLNIDTIGVLGGNVENHVGVRRNPDGTWKTYQLKPEDVERLKSREILDTDVRYKTLPLFEDAVEGYNFKPHYYELDDDAYKSLGLDVDTGTDKKKKKVDFETENDPFPKPSNIPFYLAAGLQGAGLLNNVLSPIDYSNANGMINAAYTAGNYRPIEFRPIGNYLTYRPMDVWAELNRLNANSRATDRQIMNSGANQGAINAALLANAYKDTIGSGELFRKSLEYNDALEKQVEDFNKDTDKFNSEGFLKADMANQDAETRARGFTLEGLKSGYAMKQALLDAKSNAISAGLSGLANLAYTYGTNKYNQDMIGWGIKHGVYGPLDIEGYKKAKYKFNPETGERIAAKGGKIRKRKGLNF